MKPSPFNRTICDTLMIEPSEARLVEAYLLLRFGSLVNVTRADIRTEYRVSIKRNISADRKAAEQLAKEFKL